jgi:myo-inositol-1(or 4)-monophosphatase
LLYQGTPVFGYIYVPTLNQAFHGFWSGTSGLNIPTGAFLNHGPIHSSADALTKQHLFSICSRSTGILQKNFPCKIRMLGVGSYNFLTVAIGATLGGLEATPKVWDIAGAWVIAQAAGCTWLSISSQPFPLESQLDYSDRSFPTLVVSRPELLPLFTPFLADVKGIL